MRVRRSYVFGIALVAVSVLASVLAAPEMPAEMVTHWNAADEMDGEMER